MIVLVDEVGEQPAEAGDVADDIDGLREVVEQAQGAPARGIIEGSHGGADLGWDGLQEGLQRQVPADVVGAGVLVVFGGAVGPLDVDAGVLEANPRGG